MYYKLTRGLNGTLVEAGSRLTARISVLVANTRYSSTVEHFVRWPVSILPVAQSHLYWNVVMPAARLS